MSSAETPRVDLESAIAARPLRGLSLTVPLLCGLMLVVEGVDTYAISYVAPLLGAEFSIAPESLGVIFTATVIASLLGAIGIAPLSDRIGRRKVLLLSMLLVGPATLVTPLAHTIPVLFGLRFIVGLGIGAALPTAVAQVSEYAPARYRSMLVMAMSSSIVIGMVLAGVGAALLIPQFGWRSLLYSSGALSLVCTLVAWLFIPESPRFLVQRAPDSDSTRKLLQRLLGDAFAPGAQIQIRNIAAGSSASRSPRELLHKPLLIKSLLLCFLMTMAYIVVNFAVYWLPTIILSQGYSMENAATVGSGSQLFAVVLAFVIGWQMDRRGIGRVLCTCYALAIVLFAGIAAVEEIPLAAIALLLLGLSFLSSGISGSLAFISNAYDAPMRATALGWVLGVARVTGGSIGALIGGILVGAGWSHGDIALAMSGTVALGASAFVVVLLRHRPPAEMAPAGDRTAA